MTWHPPGDLDEFAVDVVVFERRPMTLTGAEFEVAAERLIARRLSYAQIAELCRTDEDAVRRVLNRVRVRAARAAARSSHQHEEAAAA